MKSNSLETRDEILTEGEEWANCQTGECSCDAVGSPVGEELSFRFGKGEDERQTDNGLYEAATEKHTGSELEALQRTTAIKQQKIEGLWTRPNGGEREQ